MRQIFLVNNTGMVFVRLFKKCNRFYKIFMASCVVIFSHAIFAATAHTDATPMEHATEPKQLPQSVQMKGDTLVIQDGSCQTHNKTLLSSLRAKDSVKMTTAQECNDTAHE